jgi:transcriptional regulator with XRE-family HTH domain
MTRGPASPEHAAALERLRHGLGQAIKARRQTVGLTQVILAERTALHPMTVVQIERGARWPSWAAFYQIARILEVSPATLLAVAVDAARGSEFPAPRRGPGSRGRSNGRAAARRRAARRR